MATGSLDFTEYALNADPTDSDWTHQGNVFGYDGEILSDADTPGGRRWNAVADGNIRSVYWYFDGLTDDVDTESLVLIKRIAAVDAMCGAAVQSQAGQTYIGGFRNNDTDGTLRILESDGTITTLSNTSHGGLDPTVYHWVRTRRSSTTIQTKLWVADLVAADFGMSDEPGTWLIDTTDSTLTGAGSAGWFSVYSGSPWEVDLGWFGYGTAGDTAPGPAGGGGSPASGGIQFVI